VIRLGLVDSPAAGPYSKIGTDGEPEPWNSDKHKALALEVAQKSIVLLKNSGNLLPLDRNSLKSIAVIGNRANDDLIDIYGAQYPYSVTPVEGIRRKLAPSTILHHVDDNNVDTAVEAAKEAEVAVVVIGNHPVCGSTLSVAMFNTDTSTKPCADISEGREGRDRESITLSQEEFIQKIYAANPKTIVVLVSSFPYAIEWTQAHVPAILHMAHASQEEGNAIADVLFGEKSPGGRLNQTWPKSLAQLPPMEDYDIRHGRTYMYFQGEPLYPFGYGLSYTTFQYSNVKLGAPSISANGETKVTVDVRNTGSRAGDEVVQLYARHVPQETGRPKQELKGFERITLAPGEVRTVTFSVKSADLAWWNDSRHRFEARTGEVRLMVGSSSADIRGEAALKIVP